MAKKIYVGTGSMEELMKSGDEEDIFVAIRKNVKGDNYAIDLLISSKSTNSKIDNLDAFREHRRSFANYDVFCKSLPDILKLMVRNNPRYDVDYSPLIRYAVDSAAIQEVLHEIGKRQDKAIEEIMNTPIYDEPY